MIRTIAALDNIKVDHEDQNTDVNIVAFLLEALLKTIVSNAGGEDAVVVQIFKI